ncbi:MAG: TolC family protein, partial [Bacteroidota bacterium]
MRNTKILTINILFLLFISCKTNSSIPKSEIDIKIPSSYDSKENLKNAIIPKWKEIFVDTTLISLIDTTLKYNFDLRSALQKIELSRSNVRLHKGIRLPELGVNTSVGNRKFGDYTIDGVGNFDTQFSQNINENQRIPNPIPDYYAGTMFSWEIDIWGKLKNKQQAAASRLIATDFEKNFIITNLIAEVAKTYFEIQAYNYESEILKENINLQQSALDLVISQMEAGKANQLGVEMMNAQLLRSKEILVEVEQQLVEGENKMKYLCGSFTTNTSRSPNYFDEKVKA